MKNYVYTEKDIVKLVLADAKTREDVAAQPAVGSILRNNGGLISVVVFAGTLEEVQEQISAEKATATSTRALL